MVKRIISFIMCLAMMVQIVPVSNAQVVGFEDLPSSHWAYNAVSDMVNKGVIKGFEDGTFRPEEPVTREQFAKILVLALNLPKDTETTQTFSDVTKSEWAYTYVEAAKQYLTGYKIGSTMSFRGSENAVREDMAVAIVRAKGLLKETPDLTLLDKFADKNDISMDLRGYVAIAVKNKIMEGDGTNFNAQKTLTRAEACVLLYKAKGEKVVAVNLDETTNLVDNGIVKSEDEVKAEAALKECFEADQNYVLKSYEVYVNEIDKNNRIEYSVKIDAINPQSTRWEKGINSRYMTIRKQTDGTWKFWTMGTEPEKVVKMTSTANDYKTVHLEAPSNFKGILLDDGTVKLTWDKKDYTTDIYRDGICLAGTIDKDENFYIDTTAESGKTYKYTSYFNSNLYFNRDASNIITITIPETSIVPETLSAPTITVGRVSGKTEANVIVNVQLTEKSQVCGGSFNLVYDNNKLEVISVVSGELMSDMLAISNEKYTVNKIRATWAGTKPITKAGSLFIITFKIKDVEKGSTGVSIENAKLYDFDANPIISETMNGEVDIL
ncbi:MAG TPA: hypothetical protein DCP90_05380 [Clostridiales bacterium]|nr:MAG: hypothetical protein A2Y22_08825 [Clostridiales bacterium GWD2_32_59]HAN10032.1 hypothetical protein [Clostridiales bacterium]